MTPDRRQALQDILARRTVQPGTVMLSPDEARDVLELIREPELPWKVAEASGNVVAAFHCESYADAFINEMFDWHPSRTPLAIIGPDADDPDLSDCPPPGCGGDSPIPEAAMPSGCPGCGGPTEYDREDPPNPYYCDQCEYEYAVEATGCPTEPHANIKQITGFLAAAAAESSSGKLHEAEADRVSVPVDPDTLKKSVRKAEIPAEYWDEDFSDLLDDPQPTKEPAMQTITFRPYTPPRPTLDQMPAWERHLCQTPAGHEEWMLHVGGYAYDASTTCLNRLVNDPSEFIVLDADPPQPKTLADVTPWVVCVDEDGDLCWVDNFGEVQRFLSKEGYKAEQIPITRVLGFPVLEEVGDE